MKNNKGFTLIELLAIVVILGIIIALAAPNMTREIKRSEEENRNILNQKIENAAHIYAAKYYSNKIVGGEPVEFKLQDLVDDGLISFKDNTCSSKLFEKIFINKNKEYVYKNIENIDCYQKGSSNQNSNKPNSSNQGSNKPNQPITSTMTTKKTTTTTKSQDVSFFDGIDNYKEEQVIGTGNSNGKTANLKPSVIGYKTNKFIQGFAITDDYVYLSTANNKPGTSVWTNDLTEESLENISSNIYYRINRKNNNTDSIINEYAGHAQSFDVANKSVYVNGKKEDQLFFNAVPYFGLELNGKKGAAYQGFAYNRFESNNGRIIPGKTFALKKNPSKNKTPAVVIKRDENTNESFDTRIKKHIKDISNLRGDIVNGNSDYMKIPDLAVDERNNKIAFSVPGKVYVYKLSELKDNKKDAYLNSFEISRSGLQGLELYENKLYMLKGGPQNINYDDDNRKIDNNDKNFTFNVEVYNIKNTSKVTSNKYDLKVDYSKVVTFTQDRYWTVEPEGISIYDGRPYLLLMRTEKNASGKAVGYYYIDILLMEEKN